MNRRAALPLLALLAPGAVQAAAPPVPAPALTSPAEVGVDPGRLARLDAVVREGLKRGAAPGAVVLVVRQDKVIFRKAYGLRARLPAEEPMTVDTVFDLASLTKPLATATAVLVLLEQGKLRLSDPVALHLPEFGRHGKGRVTVEQLLLHTGGLIADNAVADYRDGRAKALERVWDLRPVAEPGARFRYSDVGYIVLGELVERLSGKPLDAFTREHVWGPLGMRDTGFRPGRALAARAAPTELAGGRWLRGEVHDPRARRLGGEAGHAGLFATADDVASYARMLLNGGALGGQRVLSPAGVRLMTTPRPVPGGLRALGWDVRTSYSRNRGELFGGFGHTGFTGTSLWVDPDSRTAVVFLSNRVHPDGKGNVGRLRGQVATVVAASIVGPPFPGSGVRSQEPGVRGQETETKGQGRTPDSCPLTPVLTGIDVLKRDGFRALKGRRVALVTNHTGVDRAGASTIDLLHKAEGVKLVALFSPEHGIRGAVDRPVPDGKDEKTGLPVYSLYGKRKRPAAKQLEGVDALVFDIQDIGCRFYTYETTLGYVLEAAAAHKLRVVVLDRPNPIGGTAVEGPVLDRKLESFVGYHPLPVRHGLTVGELALLFNKERKIGADLQVVKMEGWRREDLFDRTGLTWVSPSPNMRSLTAALLYPGVGLLETTNVSVGRGTDRPFEVIGAPWLDGRRLAEALTRARLPGARFVPTRFTPSSSTHAGKECGGVQLYVDDWQRFESLPVGLAIACELKRLHPAEWRSAGYARLLGHPATLAALERGEPAGRIARRWQPELARFIAVRRGYLLY
jgi:uncharacterized protein YbbC (DUF1343 family)/CubicO group peptidase (beta-lactamase class C family)